MTADLLIEDPSVTITLQSGGTELIAGQGSELVLTLVDDTPAVIEEEEGDLLVLTHEGPPGSTGNPGPQGPQGQTGPTGPVGTEPDLADLATLFENGLF